MAGISGYDSTSISVLFSSLNNTSGSTSLFDGSSDILGINYSDYACIRNGSYRQLLNAYYKSDASDEVKSALSTGTSKDDAKTLTSIQSAAADMKESASALVTSGSKSVFNKVTTKDDKGVTKTDYDTDAIYKAVSSFVEDYNALVDAVDKSDTTRILRAGLSMVKNTSANSNMLSQIGITVGTDSKLTVNEEAFKKADMTKVKSLFQGSGSYGYQVQTQAALIESHAKIEASKANTYGANGMYTYNYSTGELYSSKA